MWLCATPHPRPVMEPLDTPPAKGTFGPMAIGIGAGVIGSGFKDHGGVRPTEAAFGCRVTGGHMAADMFSFADIGGSQSSKPGLAGH